VTLSNIERIKLMCAYRRRQLKIFADGGCKFYWTRARSNPPKFNPNDTNCRSMDESVLRCT